MLCGSVSLSPAGEDFSCVDLNIEIRLHGSGDPPEWIVPCHAPGDELLHRVRQILHGFSFLSASELDSQVPGVNRAINATDIVRSVCRSRMQQPRRNARLCAVERSVNLSKCADAV